MILLDAFRSFWGDRRGNVAIMTAVALPTMLLAILGATTITKALSERRQLESIAQTACNRAVKPQRLISMTDEMRSNHARQLFDALALERGLTITERSVTSDWLQAEVKAKAVVAAMPGLGQQAAIPLSISERCTGIPPYPAKGDVILSSNFKTPSGGTVDLPFTHSVVRWGVFTAQQVGWDDFSGPGIEIQDWSRGFPNDSGGFDRLPAGVSNNFVVELDSGARVGAGALPKATCGVKGPAANSSMLKNFELHPGTYRLSLWFRSRVTKADIVALGNVPPVSTTTNKVVVYLEGTKPVLPKAAMITWDDYGTTWERRTQEITVVTYGLYKLIIAAEGCSDGSGGLFNDFKLEYIKRPAPEYNDVVAN